MVVFGFSKTRNQTSHTPALPLEKPTKCRLEGSHAPHFVWLTEAGNKWCKSVASSTSESGLFNCALFCGLYPSCLLIWLAQYLWTHYDPLSFLLPLSLSFLAHFHSWSLSTILISRLIYWEILIFPLLKKMNKLWLALGRSVGVAVVWPS